MELNMNIFRVVLPLITFFSTSTLPAFIHHSDPVFNLQDSGPTKNILAFASRYLPTNPVIIEAGGHIGSDSVTIAQFWPSGQLYSFEPVPELFQQLCLRTSGFSNTKCYQQALSDRTGMATFYLAEYAGNKNHKCGSSSLLPPKEHLDYDPGVSFPSIINIEITTLDDWAREAGIDKVDFMWLDMQGYELNMIKVSEIAKHADVIYMEVEFVEAYAGQYLWKDVKSWMQSNNFLLVAIDFNEKLIPQYLKTKKRYFGNAMFVNKSR